MVRAAALIFLASLGACQPQSSTSTQSDIEALRAEVRANQEWAEKSAKKAWENDQVIIAEVNSLRAERGLEPIEPKCVFEEGCEW